MSSFVLGDSVELATITIRVKNRDKMIAFYRDMIGFDLKGEENALAIMGTAQPQSEQLWLEESPRADDHFGQVKKLRSFSLYVPLLREFAAIFARLNKHKYPLKEIIFSKDELRIIIIDPEENQLEIFSAATGEVESSEDLLCVGAGLQVGLSADTQFKDVHLNVPDVLKQELFLKEHVGFTQVKEQLFQLNQQVFQVGVAQSTSDTVKIASHEVIGLDFLKFFINEADLLMLEENLKANQQEYFIDKKKSILTIYDPVGVEWWFTRRNK